MWIESCNSVPLIFLKFDALLFRDAVRTGAPVLASNAIWGLAMGIQTAILGHLGAQAIAANSIAATVFQILSVAAYGSASASCVIIGKTIGEGHTELVKQYAATMQLFFSGNWCINRISIVFCQRGHSFRLRYLGGQQGSG